MYLYYVCRGNNVLSKYVVVISHYFYTDKVRNLIW